MSAAAEPATAIPPEEPAAEPGLDASDLQALIAETGGGGDALIEVLHRLQERCGSLPDPLLAQVARTMRLPPSHVVGVASFYHLFRRQPAPPHRCAVCLGTACFVNGGKQLRRQVEQRLRRADLLGPGSPWGLEESGCVGACGQAPVLVVDGTLAGPLPLEPEVLGQVLTTLGVPPQAGTPAGEARP